MALTKCQLIKTSHGDFLKLYTVMLKEQTTLVMCIIICFHVEKVFCVLRLFFQMTETNCIPTYMKLSFKKESFCYLLILIILPLQ